VLHFSFFLSSLLVDIGVADLYNMLLLVHHPKSQKKHSNVIIKSM